MMIFLKREIANIPVTLCVLQRISNHLHTVKILRQQRNKRRDNGFEGAFLTSTTVNEVESLDLDIFIAKMEQIKIKGGGKDHTEKYSILSHRLKQERSR